MKTIYKYTLTGRYTTEIEMPVGAEIIHFAEQQGQYCIWAMVNPDADKEKRTFTVVGTGWELDDDVDHRHIGSVFDGPFVWHILEIV